MVGLQAVAREVVQTYSDNIMEHPVGTGPFQLTRWDRSSRIVLSRNPGFRAAVFNTDAAEGDGPAQKIARQLRGRRLPMLDQVEVFIIEEAQPRWLAFLNGEHQLIRQVPEDFVDIAMPHNQLAPELVRRGLQAQQHPLSEIVFTYFNMKDPVVGGYAPEKVALRRAIGLAYDSQTEIDQTRHRQAIIAESILPPMAFGYSTTFRSEMSLYDPARAKALLDLYGYVDHDGDGWRDLPDGSPLLLRFHTQGDQRSRQINELWRKFMNAVQLRIEFKVATWPEQLKAARAGRLMMWALGNGAESHDADGFLAMGYGPQAGAGNFSFFSRPEFDTLYEHQAQLSDGPERLALMQEAAKWLIAYMPYKVHAHRIATDLAAPELIGYWRHPFMVDYWQFLDLSATTPKKIQ